MYGHMKVKFITTLFASGFACKCNMVLYKNYVV